MSYDTQDVLPVAAATPGEDLVGQRTGRPSREQGAELRSMARGSVLNLFGVGWAGVFGFVLVIILTKGLGPRQYGVFAVATALFTILFNIGQLGSNTGLLRQIPRLKVLNRPADIRVTLLISLLPTLAVGAIMAVLVWVFAPQLASVLVKEVPAGQAEGYFRVLAPFLLVASAAPSALAGVRGFGSSRLFVLVQNIAIPTLRPVAALAVLALGFGGVAVTVTWSAPIAISFVVGAVALARLSRRAQADGGAPARPVGETSREFWSFAAARGVAGAIAIAVTWMPILFLGSMRSAREAGTFSAVSRYAIMASFAFQAMRVAIGPQISALLAQKRKTDAEAVYQTATWWLMALSWPFFLSLCVFAPTWLSVFGNSFTDGAAALTLICLSGLVDMGTGNVTLVLLMSGRSSFNLFNISAGLTVNLVLSLLLIPPYGVLGAAIAWAATVLTENLLAVAQVRYFMQMRPFGPGYPLVAFAALGCFGAVGLAARLTFGSSASTLFGSAAIGGVVYAALMWRWRHRLHFGILADVVRRRRRGPARARAGATA